MNKIDSLTAERERNRKARQNETEEQRTQRLENMHENYKRRNCINKDNLMSSLNKFA